MAGEAGDIAADYITARLTRNPNVIAVTKPFLTSSFRADMEATDNKGDQTKKYNAASRNFKVSFKFVCSLVTITSLHLTFHSSNRPVTEKQTNTVKSIGVRLRGTNTRPPSYMWPTYKRLTEGLTKSCCQFICLSSQSM
jgi:hypothetical protein